jgi:hypothetical protein
VSTPQQQHAHGHAPPPPPQPTDHAHAGHGDYAPVSGGSCLGADPESLDSPAEAASERGVSGGGWPA